MIRVPFLLSGLLITVLIAIGCGDDSDNPGFDTDSAMPDAGRDGGDEEDAGPPKIWECVLPEGDTDPDYIGTVGCMDDYKAVAAPPPIESIPGTLSVKTVIDRIDDQSLYFQNSRRYQIHFDFASTHLSGNGLPPVIDLARFNETEYYSTDRRFILGALNYYEGPDTWTYELAPYDKASSEMIEAAYDLIREHVFVGDELQFHPTSDSIEMNAAELPVDIPIVDTDTLFKGITYQPLNLATAMGQLRFVTAAELEETYLSFRDIAVIDAIPNDISVLSGTITDAFQTPLSHINVLAQNRGTPNMALKGAFNDPKLRALEGEWVSLTVGASGYKIEKVDKATADDWWRDNKPPEIVLPTLDLSVTDLRDIEEVLDIENLGLEEALAKAIPAFGGKASHYGGFPHIDSMVIPYPKAFVVPVYHYRRFMEENGFDEKVAEMLADEDFQSSPKTREAVLEALQEEIESAPLNPDFEAELVEKLTADFEGLRMRFRSSTNCEDLGGFTGAGLYTSASGDPNDPSKPYDEAIKKVWAAVWRFRAFEERSYRSISHEDVGMAVLIHPAFPSESVNGVAITANIFDPKGIEPGYYVNAQAGGVSVVLPPAGITSDEFIYHYDLPGQPIQFLGHSNLVATGTSVMTRSETAELAAALKAIHLFFNPVYGPNMPGHFYAMDVEFKFDEDDSQTDPVNHLIIKQARPYPGRGESE